jgi:hypothetical protein
MSIPIFAIGFVATCCAVRFTNAIIQQKIGESIISCLEILALGYFLKSLMI